MKLSFTSTIICLSLFILSAGTVTRAGSGLAATFSPAPITPVAGYNFRTADVSDSIVGGIAAPPGVFGVTPTVSPVALNPQTGNVSRVVTDYKLQAISEVGLEFKRYLHTRGNGLLQLPDGTTYNPSVFGGFGGWRHSFQWDFVLDTSKTNAQITIQYPDGTVCIFSNTTAKPNLFYCTFSAVTDFIAGPDSQGEYVLIRSNNQSYHFASNLYGPSSLYHLSYILDSKGEKTTLLYQWLVSPAPVIGSRYVVHNIIDAGGNSYSLLYSTNGTLTAMRVSTVASIWIYYAYSVYSTQGITRPSNPQYKAFDCLTNVQVNNANYTGSGYTYQVRNLSNAGDIYAELTWAFDYHCDGPPVISLAYGGTKPGVVSTVSCNNLKIEEVDETAPSSGGGVKFYNSFNQNQYTELTWSVDTNGQVAAITNLDPQHNVDRTCYTSYTVNAVSGAVTTVSTDARGHATTTLRDRSGHVTSVIYPLITGDSAPASESWIYALDGNNFSNLQSHTDSQGHTTTYTYFPSNTAPVNFIPTVSYAVPQLLKSIQYPDGTSDIYSYEPKLFQHNQVGVSSTNNNYIVKWATHTRRNGHAEAFTYFRPSGLLNTVTDAQTTGQTVYTYTALPKNEIQSIRDPNRNLTRYSYSAVAGGAYSKITTICGSSSVVTTFDAYGRKVAVLAEGLTTKYGFDSLGRVNQVIDPLGREVTLTYNYPNNSSSPDVIRSVDNTVAHRSNGRSVTTDNEMLWGYLPVQVTTTNSLANETETTTTRADYDEMGNQLHYTDARGNTSITSYDERSRPFQTVGPTGEAVTTKYDLNGNIKTVTTAAGLTKYFYDVMGRLHCSIDPANQSGHYEYDPEGKIKAYVDPSGGSYQYFYDNNERLIKMAYPDSTNEQYFYDANGNVTSKTFRDGSVEQFNSYTYFNKPQSISWQITGDVGTTPAIQIKYNTDQTVQTIQNANAIITYGYDAGKRITAETEQIIVKSPSGTLGGIVTNNTLGRTAANKFSYTLSQVDDSVSGVIYPDKTALSYAYGGLGELTTITKNKATTPLVQYTYDSVNCTSKALANGITTNYNYYPDERLQSMSDTYVANQVTNTVQSFALGYDGNKRVKYVKRETGLGDVYKYDASNQIQHVLYGATNPDSDTPTSPAHTTDYSFDGSGNRLQVTYTTGTSSNTLTYTPDTLKSNQYTSVQITPLGGTADTKTVSYSTGGLSFGNLQAYGDWTYTYDAYGCLTQATNGSIIEKYRYDPLGRRVAEYSSTTGSTTGTTTYHLYGLGWDVTEDFTVTGGEFAPAKLETMRYVYGSATDEIITCTAISGATETDLFYLYDAAGNVSKLTRSNGVVQEQYDYDIFGRPTVNGDPSAVSQLGNRYLYAGREYNFNTELYQYRNRDYSPKLGRFMQTDPVGHGGDTYNLYRFCSNDPVNNSDPSGCDDFSDGGGNFGGLDFGYTGNTGSDFSVGVSSLSFSGFGMTGLFTQTQNSVSVPNPSPGVVGNIQNFSIGQLYAIGDMAIDQLNQTIAGGDNPVLGMINVAMFGPTFSHLSAPTGADRSFKYGYASAQVSVVAASFFMPAGVEEDLTLAAEDTTTVTSWAGKGLTPDLNPRRWVQLGNATRWNFIKTGLWGPKAFFQDSAPFVRFESSAAPFTPITGEVPTSSLRWPSGWEAWKGLLGQRVITE